MIVSHSTYPLNASLIIAACILFSSLWLAKLCFSFFEIPKVLSLVFFFVCCCVVADTCWLWVPQALWSLVVNGILYWLCCCQQSWEGLIIDCLFRLSLYLGGLESRCFRLVRCWRWPCIAGGGLIKALLLLWRYAPDSSRRCLRTLLPCPVFLSVHVCLRFGLLGFLDYSFFDSPSAVFLMEFSLEGLQSVSWFKPASRYLVGSSYTLLSFHPECAELPLYLTEAILAAWPAQPWLSILVSWTGFGSCNCQGFLGVR